MDIRIRLETTLIVLGVFLLLVGALAAGPGVPATHAGFTPTPETETPPPEDTPVPTDTPVPPTETPEPEGVTPTPEDTPAPEDPTPTPVPELLPETGGNGRLALLGAGAVVLLVGAALRWGRLARES